MSIMPNDIETRLLEAAPAGIQFRAATDDKSVATAWCTLASSDNLLSVGLLLKRMGARLSTITVFQPKAAAVPKPKEGEEPLPLPTFLGGTPQDGKTYEIDYHFDIDGDTLTVTAHVAAGGSIDSLTPLYRAADWPERELMELYALVVRDHPNPQRLFIDPSIDNAVFERLIPYSTLVNSAASKSIWEKIMAQTGAPS
ncbi:MAG: NADH-quinone oxidoreductase subunit C [Rhodocyclales bacterium]|jgi:NADH:ubiquinone oxidoreductase subunit C|nr:NADH-quinone oxidoreductase subunit C [Rhodocyclales bacterium]